MHAQGGGGFGFAEAQLQHLGQFLAPGAGQQQLVAGAGRAADPQRSEGWPVARG